MSKRQFKSQASSSRATFGIGFSGFGSPSTTSTLSYLAEPPNLASISDANVVVAFKNLSKKDDKTKSKGLEDLTAYVLAHPFEQGGTEEPVLEAWVKFYPRLSIDNSRRVRELSHTLSFELLKSARKRMEKYIPKIIGVWLAGTYDQDRGISRAATNGITHFLNTEEKQAMIYTRCQPQILEYVEEAVNETPQTLSDERTMSLEDMQAKYHRAVGCSISLLFNLLAKLGSEDILKHQDKYDTVLSSKKLWALAAGEDSFVRRTVDQLLIVCLAKQSTIIDANLDIMSQIFTASALRAPQSASTLHLVQVLSALTAKYPQIWTLSKKGKGTASSRLKDFIEKGSQGGPADFWPALRTLFSALPDGVLPSDTQAAIEFLLALRTGFTRREEPRSNIEVAWPNYFAISKLVSSKLSNPATAGKLFQESVYPAFGQYIHPITENSRWSISSSTHVVTAYMICDSIKEPNVQETFVNEWQRLADELISRLQTTLPEQSKDYRKSQDAVAAESRRWFELLAGVTKARGHSNLSDFVSSPSTKLLNASLSIMTNRSGKPYSAAATLDSALRLVPELFESSSNLELLKDGLEKNLEALIRSPSRPYLLSTLLLFGSLPAQATSAQRIWQTTMKSMLSTTNSSNPPSDEVVSIITALISYSEVKGLAQSCLSLQEFLIAAISSTLAGVAETWPLTDAAITFDSLCEQAMDEVLQKTIVALDEPVMMEGAFKILELIAQRNPILLQSHSIHVALITKLLACTELNDTPIVSRAQALRSVIERSDEVPNLKSGSTPILNIIRENLDTANSQSLHVDTLLQQAMPILENEEDPSTVASLFPDTRRWSEALLPLYQQHPNPALAVMRPFAGAIFAINTPIKPIQESPTDLNGYSVPLRMASYSASLATVNKFSLIAREIQLEIFRLVFVTAELASDRIDVLEPNQLFNTRKHLGVIDEVRQFISHARALMTSITSSSRSWRRNPEDAVIDSHDSSAVAHEMVFKLLEASATRSPEGYYASKVLSHLISQLVDENGWHSDGGEDWLSRLDVLKSSTTNLFGATAVLYGIGENLSMSKLVNNLCNRVISDIAGAKVQSEKTIPLLVLLNATLSVYEHTELPVASNRLVFAVKNILSWTPELTNASTELSSEACYALQRLLPGIKDVYGSYWTTTVEFCIAIWSMCSDGVLSDERVPAVGMSLKLFSILQNLDDANEDLIESLADYKEKTSEGLINLLALRRVKVSQPLEYVDDLLSRLISKLPTRNIHEVTEFYPLVASEFRTVQSSAFDVLHKSLPEAQQQISVDVLLEKRDAQLSEELLSLLLDAPTIKSFNAVTLSEFPTSIRGYLLSWHLVFDSYADASHKVRDDYTEILKQENYIGPLLCFMFDVFGHSAGKPINLDKMNFEPVIIRKYDMWKAVDTESLERDMQWLMLNIYYSALKFTPNLVKTWWMDCKSKQTRMAVESWTERFFSPLIISDTFEAVDKWAREQVSNSDEEKDLEIKTFKVLREVTAGYEIDDTQTKIMIRLPPNYPLDNVKVEGINRVGASEKKWTSWLMTTQGAITFSNGSIIDGLIVFRRNIIGALKNQTECAICYSIISPEKRMPDKRCHTCNNLFHADCLFKWFSSSSQSTCPLCRNPFTFRQETGARRQRDVDRN